MLALAVGLALFAQEPGAVSNPRLAVLQACADRSDLTTECPGIGAETALVAACVEDVPSKEALLGCVTQRMTDCMETDDDGTVPVPVLARWCNARIRAGLSNVVAQRYRAYAAGLPNAEGVEFRTVFLGAVAKIEQRAAAHGGDAFQVNSLRTGMLAQLAFSLVEYERSA